MRLAKSPFSGNLFKLNKSLSNGFVTKAEANLKRFLNCGKRLMLLALSLRLKSN